MPTTQLAKISPPLPIDSFTTDASLPCEDDVGTRASAENDFNALYAAWFEGVLRWTSALGVRTCDTHDVAQSVFLVVHRRLPAYHRNNIGGWLYRITVNQVRDYRKQLWNRAFFNKPESMLEMIPSLSPTPVALLEAQEAGKVLTHALSRLSEKTRATFLLFDVQGFSCEEIASLHRVVPNTVWARLRRARQRVVPRLLEWRNTDRIPA